MKKSKLALLACLLFFVAVAAALTSKDLASVPFPDSGIVIGVFCGMSAILVALRMTGRWSASLVLILSFAAILLAGPTAVFLILFGLMTGLGGLIALFGTMGGAGMEGVGLQSAGLVATVLVSIFGIISLAWAIIRAFKAWAESA